MSQQTAVQRLEQQIRYYISNDDLLDDMFEQAKAMEKEQITFAYNDGADAMVAGKYKAMDDYYNEMYQSRQDKADK
jgi:hypothetical protein